MHYQIHRYPTDLIDVVQLAGRRVVIRPVLPQDEPITAAFFGNLPSSARYDRFMSPMRNIPPELLVSLTHIDYSDHLALVAVVFDDGNETIVAEARYARKPDVSEAEFAVSVAAQWQGQGLASLLLSKLLCRAATAGLDRIVGETFATNERMLHLARKAGFTLRRSPDVQGVTLLEKVVRRQQPRISCGDADAQGAMAA